MAILQPVGTSLVEEVDVFYEQAEERDDNLQENQKRKGFHFTERCEGGFHMTQVCVVCINIDSKGKDYRRQRESLNVHFLGKTDPLLF